MIIVSINLMMYMHEFLDREKTETYDNYYAKTVHN